MNEMIFVSVTRPLHSRPPPGIGGSPAEQSHGAGDRSLGKWDRLRGAVTQVAQPAESSET